MKVVILAGGKGTRLGLEGLPKPMVPVNGVPLLERLVVAAKQSGFTDFIFLNGYLGEVIEKYFADGQKFGVNIQHVQEEAPLGTAGALGMIRHLLKDPFLVLYGDILLDVDLKHFTKFALTKGGAGTLFVHPNDHPHDSDLLASDSEGRIVKFYPKPHQTEERLPNLVSAALYVLSPLALKYVPSHGSYDWGKDIFPKLANSEALYAYRSCEYAKDVGTKSRLAKAEADMTSGRVHKLSRSVSKPALFLDRDGVINVERDGIFSSDQMELLPGAAEAIQMFNLQKIPVICVTNQPALAKGQMSWEDLRRVHAEMDCQLAEQTGAYLDDVLICPHHPEKGRTGEVPELKIECDCRKPKPGLILAASNFHNIDLSRSWLIGDRYCDISAAQSAGVSSILVNTGHAGSDKMRYNVEPNAQFENIYQAASYVLGKIT